MRVVLPQPKGLGDLIVRYLGGVVSTLNRALARGLSLTDNTVHQIVSVGIKTSATYSGGDWTPVSIAVSPERRVAGVVLVSVVPGAVTATVTWAQAGEVVVISRLAGLSNSTSYQATFLIL